MNHTLKRTALIFAATGCLIFSSSISQAATIAAGDPTSSLEGTLFLNDASTGGGDNTIHDDGGEAAIGIRGLGFTTGSPGTITISGFGFASSASEIANDATSITMRFEYLGADGVLDGAEAENPDDVTIGTVENIQYSFTGAGTYFVNFGEEAVSGQIDGANDQFRIYVSVDDNDSQLQESIRFKTVQGVGTKMSISGTFEAGIADPTWAGYDIQDGGFVNTMDFLGWLSVGEGSSAWVFSYSLEKFIYLPESAASGSSGSWVYLPNF